VVSQRHAFRSATATVPFAIRPASSANRRMDVRRLVATPGFGLGERRPLTRSAFSQRCLTGHCDAPILPAVGLDRFRRELREFARARDWERFHTPKNLAMALAAEAGELLEVFQWLSDEQARPQRLDEATRAAAHAELADVVIYAIRLSDVLEIDLDEAVKSKIESNGRRYPVETDHGKAEKRA
jgi:dCTP diphosphatase